MKNSTEFTAFQAYQHFLYYIDIRDIIEKKIWGTHLTNHFAEKFTYQVSRAGKGYASIDAVVGWVQDMTPDHQKTLLDYIIKNHTNKW